MLSAMYNSPLSLCEVGAEVQKNTCRSVSCWSQEKLNTAVPLLDKIRNQGI